MAIPYLLLQTIVVPLIAAAVTYPLGRRLGRRVGWVSFAALLYTSVLLLLAGIEIFNTGAPIREEYAWAAIIGLKFGFLADNLSLPVALVMNAVVAATSVYSMPYMKHRL